MCEPKAAQRAIISKATKRRERKNRVHTDIELGLQSQIYYLQTLNQSKNMLFFSLFAGAEWHFLPFRYREHTQCRFNKQLKQQS